MEDKNGYFLLSTDRFIALKAIFQSELDNNSELSEMFDHIIADQATAKGMALKLETSTIVFTKTSNAIRDKAAEDFSITASTMSGYGVKNNIDILSGMKRYTFSEIRGSSLTHQVTACNKIKEVIENYKVPLESIGIDAAIRNLLADDITKMGQLTAIPQDMIDQHAIDNKLFNDHLDLMRKKFREQIDKAMQIYRIKNINFFMAYTAARKVRHHHLKRKLKEVDLETTTGTLELLILEKTTLEPMVGVKLVVALLNLVAESDEDGETYTDEIKPGTYQGKLFFDGYQTIDFEFVIEAGKTCTLQFQMEVETIEN
ncbi:MAG: hypothetical protein WCH34_00925 [Bacteroidota bacterium]